MEMALFQSGFFDQFGSDGSDDEVSDNGEPLWWADACETSEEEASYADDDTTSSEDDMPELIPRHEIPRHLLPDDSSSSDESESTSDSMPSCTSEARRRRVFFVFRRR